MNDEGHATRVDHVVVGPGEQPVRNAVEQCIDTPTAYFVLDVTLGDVPLSVSVERPGKVITAERLLVWHEDDHLLAMYSITSEDFGDDD